MLCLSTTINGRKLRLNLRSGEIFMQNRSFKDNRWVVKVPFIVGNYMCIVVGNSNQYKLHRIIYKFHNPNWDIEDGSNANVIDHINRITTDNSIQNLRNVTSQQNQWNRTSTKGYCWCKNMGKWKAYIKVNRRCIHLGYYDLKEDARNAYLEAKKIYHIID